MKILWILVFACGVWFVASSLTEDGLLPSGHGVGWLSELVLGLAAIAYSIFRLTGGFRRKENA